MAQIADIDGWQAIVDWFGFTPNFHDAEVVSIDLRREPEVSFVRVHAWRTNEDLTESGHFRQDRHALVTFSIKRIRSSHLTFWNHQNVLSELWIEQGDEGLVLKMPGIYGLDGEITALNISASIEAYDP